MSYVYLKYGDRLPSVAVTQKLLNIKTGISLRVDGVYLGKTRNAVRDFQKKKGVRLTGVIDENTWKRLSHGNNNLRIIDCVDIFDPNLNSESRAIRRAGGKPILIPGMSGGVKYAVNEIIRVAGNYKTFILRFHGHGSAGNACVGEGTGVSGKHGSTIRSDDGAYLAPLLAQLSKIFSRYGCIQMMGCSLARGKSGRLLIRNISALPEFP